MIHVVHQRTKYRKDRTPGEVWVSNERICYSVEDELRELPGVPVAQWKVKTATAIPGGHYRVTLIDSPKFGKDALWIRDVPGYEGILIHGGNDETHTSGCVLMGAALTADDKVVPGQSRPALAAIRAILVPALKTGDSVVWDVRHPPGYAGPLPEAQKPAPAILGKPGADAGDAE